MARKLSILVAAMMVIGMIGFAPIALADDDDEGEGQGPVLAELCLAGLIDCSGEDGTEEEDDDE
jgi:hypothetical protein